MADTGSKRYSIQEALNRILRSLQGNPAPYDAPESLSGEVLATNEAWSAFAELVEGNDPSNTFTLPNGTTINQFTAEDAVINDQLTANVLDTHVLYVGTGTFYAGTRNISLGGFYDSEFFGEGEKVFGFADATVIPSGTISHLGGVLYSQGGALKWLGSSGTVTTLAGS